MPWSDKEVRAVTKHWNRAAVRPTYANLLKKAKLAGKSTDQLRTKVQRLLRDGKLKAFPPLEASGKST